MRRRGLLRNVSTAYPGVLGVTTEKGQQDVKPNVLDAPTESYEIMLLRWQTGVFEVGAPAPEFIPEAEYPELAFNLQQQLMALSMPSPTAKELAIQIITGVYSANRLAWAGIPTPLAMYLATSLKDGTYNAVKAVGLGMVPAIATLLPGGGGSEPVLQRIVGANGAPSQALLGTSGTHNTFESRFAFFVGIDSPFIQLSIDNWAIAASGADTVPPGALSIDGLAIESDSLAATMPAYFAASRTIDIVAGTTQLCDKLFASAFGLPKFTRGERYWVRLRGHVALGTGQIPADGRRFNPAGHLSSRFDPTAGSNGVSQVDAVGPMTSKTGQDSFGGPLSITAVIGESLDRTIPSVVAIGDSIGDKSFDVGSTITGPAFIARGCFGADYRAPVPNVNLCRGSSSTVTTAASLERRAFYFAYADLLIDESGTGGLAPNGPNTAAENIAADNSIIAAFKDAALPNSKVIKTKVIPRLSAGAGGTSDSYSTSGGQTTDATFVANAATFNANVDTLLGNGTINAIHPMLSVRDGADPTKWFTNGTANYATPDGTHPSALFQRLLGFELRTIIESLYSGVAQAQVEYPSTLFTGGRQGYWESVEPSMVFSDAAGTIPATVGGPVQCIKDKSGNLHHFTEATNPPTLRSGSITWPTYTLQQYWLELDGTNDKLRTAAFADNTAGEWFASAAIRPDSIIGNRQILNADTAVAQSRLFQFRMSSAQDQVIAFNVAQTSFNKGNGANIAISTDHVAQGGVKNTTVAASIDGVMIGAATAITGTVESVNVMHTIGASSASTPTEFFQGRLYDAVFLAREETIYEAAALVTYQAWKEGLVL